MDPDVLAFAQVAAVIVCLAGSLATIGVFTFRAITRSAKPELSGTRKYDERLEHLQHSVDAIALEVERIAEAQRFSAKLLAERSEGSPVR